MKKNNILLLLILFSLNAVCQEKNKKVYFTDPGEFIFQFTKINIEENSAENGVRTSFFTNFPYYMNINFNNHFGLIPGISIKNIGIKTKNEQIIQNTDTTTFHKIKRRVFTAGLSFAVKAGDFRNGWWLSTGAGIDWAFHYRQKLFETSNNKKVTKAGEWMSDATPTVIPSVFFSIQTPISLNIKATYYFNDFLNKDYKGTLGDFSKFTQSQLFTISLSVIIKELPEKYASEIPIDQPNKKERIIEL